MTTTTATRPVWADWIGRSRRAEVQYRRAASAYDLAARLHNPPTVDDVDAAEKLLASVRRYALADAREWEAENSSEWYCNSAEHEAREKQLDARRARLQKALNPYRVRLENFGLYPSIVDDNTGNTLYLLHYYD